VVNVSLNEVDAAKVASGDPVTLTFDALPSLTIPGTVSYLDPLGTVSQGVVNYAVQIALNVQNDQIKTGMTASAVIVTQTHTGVLMVPTSAITKIGNRSMVLVPTHVTASSAPYRADRDQYICFNHCFFNQSEICWSAKWSEYNCRFANLGYGPFCACDRWYFQRHFN